MSLKHTLLGLLILRPGTGYELNKRIERLMFLLTPATLRRIYLMLKRMTEEGLVVYEVEPQEGRPDRKVYSVTDEGEAEFLEWLREPAEEDPHSLNPFFLKFFFYGMLDKETVSQRVCQALAYRQEQLRVLRSVEIGDPRGPSREIVDPKRVGDIWRMMLGYGLAQTETEIKWLEDVLEKLGKDHS